MDKKKIRQATPRRREVRACSHCWHAGLASCPPLRHKLVFSLQHLCDNTSFIFNYLCPDEIETVLFWCGRSLCLPWSLFTSRTSILFWFLPHHLPASWNAHLKGRETSIYWQSKVDSFTFLSLSSFSNILYFASPFLSVFPCLEGKRSGPLLSSSFSLLHSASWHFYGLLN